MTSKVPAQEAYVWVWLPGATRSVVAGRLHGHDGLVTFNYGKSYLERPDAIPLYLPELPLEPGELPLPTGLSMPGCLRDAAPDAWGRRVILNRWSGIGDDELEKVDPSELTYPLASGSDRIGALDFQRAPDVYEPRAAPGASLEDLLRAAERVEKGIPLTSDLDQALCHGSSVGGARPKTLIDQGGMKQIAKFPSSSDGYNVVKSEFIAMRLVALCGIAAAPVSLVRACGKDVLLVERFDRVPTEGGWQRRIMVSALTLLGLDENVGRHASYRDLAEIVRHRFTEPSATLHELFARLVFNVLCGNSDDHARNHAAFWDGRRLSLSPAYDICPQGRAGQDATQAMLIVGQNRMSRIASCLAAAHHFLLSQHEAMSMVATQLRALGDNWDIVRSEAALSQSERDFFWGRLFLNPFAFTALEGEAAGLARLADAIRGKN